MRYAVNIEDLYREIDILRQSNETLNTEIRNLRCVMVEAASSINPAREPELFSRLTGNSEYFVSGDYNPYPEHDDHVGEQYLNFLVSEAKKKNE